MRYFTPTIVVLDVDGIINSSPIARLACNGYMSAILAQLPILKRAALGTLEIGEILLDTKYEPNDNMDFICLNRDVPYLGIITDRSPHGLVTALGRKSYILEWMSFVQVRKSIFGSVRKLKHGPEIWETRSVKPDESVLYRLADFTREKGVKPHEVLIIDDDPLFRFIAKSRFGFRVEPDDTIDEIAREDYLPSIERAIALT